MWKNFLNWLFNNDISSIGLKPVYFHYVVYKDTNNNVLLRQRMHNNIIIPQVGTQIKHELINGTVVKCSIDGTVDYIVPEKDTDWEYVTIIILKD